MGNYSGVDSTWVSDGRRDFGFHSHITELTEARSVAGRADIRGLLRGLAQKREVCDDYVCDVEENASTLFKDKVNRGGVTGSTMMTLADVMRLQRSVVESLYIG